MTARARRGVLGVVSSLVLLVACGGESGGISEDTSNSLQYQVEAIRASAQSSDPDGVERRLAELRAAVAQLKADGELDDERSAAILAAAADVEAQIDVVPTTTTAPPPPPEDDDDDDDKKGKGGGKGDDD